MNNVAKKFNFSLNGLYTLLSILFLIVERSIYMYFDDKVSPSEWSTWDPDILPLVGIMLGAIIIVIFYNYFFEKRRYNLAAIITFPILLYLSLWIISTTEIGEDFLDLIFGQTSQFFDGILLGILLGYLINSAFYLFNNYFVFTAIYILIVFTESYSAVYDENNKGILYFLFLIFVLFVSTLIAFRFYVGRYYKDRKDQGKAILKLIIGFALILGGGSILGILGTNSLKNYIENRVDELDRRIEEKRAEEEKKKQEENSDTIPIDAPLSDAIQLIAMYNAPEPMYLKFETFNVNQNIDKLTIKPVDENALLGDGFLYSSEDNKDNGVKIIFAKLPDQKLLTPERITYYDPAGKSKREGMLISYNTGNASTLERYELKYRAWIKPLDIEQNIWPEDNFAIDKNSYPYVYVSSYSERYRELEDLAYEIVEEADAFTDYEKALAIRDYFHENFTYTLNPGFTDKVNPIDDFILDMKRGYCLQYAVATSYLLEILDVESRVVGGYFSSIMVMPDTYAVIPKQAHAWTEVYIQNVGWITIDSTPGSDQEEGIVEATEVSEEEERELKIQFVAQDPEVSFDDMYEDPEIIEENFQPEEDRGSSIIKVVDQDSDSKKEEEQESLEEENKEKFDIEEFERKIKEVFKWIFISILVFLASAGLYKLYPYVKNHNYYTVLRLDKNLRKYFIKRLGLKINVLSSSPKLFMRSIPKEYKTEQLKDFYNKVDKLLYKPGESIVRDDVIELQSLKREIESKTNFLIKEHF